MSSDPDFPDPFDDDLLSGLGGGVSEAPSKPAHDAHEASERLRTRRSASVVRSPSASQWSVGNVLGMAFLMLVSCCIGGLVFHGGGSPDRITGGSAATGDPRPAETVTATATRTVASVPESCQAAMQYTQQILPYVRKILNASTPAIQALQDAYVAISTKDYAAINKAQTKIHNVESGLSDPALGYNQLLQDATTSMAACLDKLNGR
jgi:hypothetical protein